MAQPLLIHCPSAAPYTKRIVLDIVPPVFENKFEFPSSLGDFVSTGVAANDQFASVLDGAPVVRTYNNFTVTAGHTVTPVNRCKGLYLNILGNLTVNGTLSMTARGAKALGKNVVVDPTNQRVYFIDVLDSQFDYSKFTIISKSGAQGIIPTGNSLPVRNANGACGCGGGTVGARGGHGTSFSGGAGAGGGVGYSTGDGSAITNGTPGTDNGGAGGAGVYMGGWSGAEGGGGGAGNPGGSCKNPARNGANGTGGLMILFVHGEVIINTSGSIQANGSAGGANHGAAGQFGSGRGAGSGGGAIYLFAKGNVLNPTKITASGGPTTGTVSTEYLATAGSPGTAKVLKF